MHSLRQFEFAALSRSNLILSRHDPLSSYRRVVGTLLTSHH